MTIDVRATALNHHDLWSLKGVGLAEQNLPMILGLRRGGLDPDGNEVVVHAVISDPAWKGDETLDPKRSLLSERYQGTLAREGRRTGAERRTEAGRAELRAGCVPADGVADGVPDAVHAVGAEAGRHRAGAGRGRRRGDRADHAGAGRRDPGLGDQPGRGQAGQGASRSARTTAFESGARLPERVDAVMETVGQATWSHSLKSLKQGGTLVISGATSGQAPKSAELNRIFFLQLRVQGSTMGTRTELAELVQFMANAGHLAAHRHGPPAGRRPQRASPR